MYVPVALALLAVGCSSPGPDRHAASSFAGRVRLVNHALSLVNGKGNGVSTQTFSPSASSGYTYIAAVNPPVNAATGDVLQATNFAFDATRSYVAYNMAGPKIEGAFDIVDLSDVAKPRIVGSLLFPDAEFADVALSGNYAVLSGQDQNGGELSVVDVSDPTNPAEVARLDLGSYYGTSIKIDGTTAYITTGDQGGGVVTVDIASPRAPRVIGVVPVPNALHALRAGGRTLVLGGDPDTHLYAVDGQAAVDLATIATEHFDAPGRMAITNGSVITNGHDTGLSILTVAPDLSSASVLFHAPLTGTGNGIDIAGGLAILAQGEAGTLVYDVSNPASPHLLGSFSFPDESGSANEVRFGTTATASYVFLSDGLQGFRIVQIAPPAPAPVLPTLTGGAIVGYYTPSAGMPASAVPYDLITHVAQAFAFPEPGGGVVGMQQYIDGDLIASAHAKGVRVVASLGGAAANFIDATAAPAARAKTVADLAALCGDYGYDGIDLDWEFPEASTMGTFVSFIQDLSEALHAIRADLTVSAVVSPSVDRLKLLPDATLESLSWIGVETYDYAGGWSTTAGYVAPLYPTVGEDGGSVSGTLSYMVGTRGLTPSKIFIGLPFYGYELNGTKVGDVLVNPSTQLDYRDIVPMIGVDGWTQAWDSTAEVPYLTRAANPGFVTYEDAQSVQAKCAYAKSLGLGGAIVWHIGADTMPDGSNPLLAQAAGCR